MTRSLAERLIRATIPDQLGWQMKGEDIVFFVWCSDIFRFNCVDVQVVTENTIECLERAVQDIKDAGGTYYATELFAARIRKMRPTDEFLKEVARDESEKVVDLFKEIE